MSRTRIALDAVAADGRALHELVADPREAADDADGSLDGDGRFTDSRSLALVDAVSAARHAQDRATRAEAEAVAPRRAANKATARVIALADSLLESWQADALGTLSPQQPAVVRARIEIADEGDVPTHHEVARRLGLHPAAVSRQRAQIVAKLAAANARNNARNVSTSSA